MTITFCKACEKPVKDWTRFCDDCMPVHNDVAPANREAAISAQPPDRSTAAKLRLMEKLKAYREAAISGL